MNIDIRKSIHDNFKDANESEIRASITSAIEDKDEITLPGLGVFLELLWENSDESSREYIISTIKKGI
ncbi:MAG: small acid-soluble spore protein SspI [Bacilli bacterium]|nr:small acid-soluble spore protein SspI [Bacilli bacterium]